MVLTRHFFGAALLALLSVSFPPSANLRAQSPPPLKVCRCNGWVVAVTASFWVCCYGEQLPAAKIAAECESVRNRLSEKWLSDKSPATWTPKCMVVLQPSQESYLAAVGQEAGGTAGSSVVERNKDFIVKRRIDLRGDRTDYMAAALPHELTHIVLADHFAGRPLPRWADEGMAMLADTEAKRDLHARDLCDAWAQGTTVRLTDLLPSVDYPSSQQWGAFYGQSLSVVDYLVHRGAPHKFVQFLDAAKTSGYDRALRDYYGIQDMKELDRLWAATLAHPPVMLAKAK